MKIGVVQLEPIHGDIEANIARHEQFARLAASYQVEMIVFPELSLVQYDAPYAEHVATTNDDPRLTQLQQVADETNIIICAGIPLKNDNGNTISMLIFQPSQPLQRYDKHYLHDDEKPFFVSGTANPSFPTLPSKIAFVVCYELFVPQHAEDAHNRGASVYLASVAKTHSGMERANVRLANISYKYGMSVFQKILKTFH